MIPLRDDNPHVLTPVVTLGVIGLNLFAWFSLQGLGAEVALIDSVCELGLIPARLLGELPPGRVVGPCGVIPRDAGWYTLLTSMFLHGGWGHLIGNMWFLWIFGNNVEDSMGHVRFTVFYLLCGLVAAVLQIVSGPGSTVPMVGASGAIGGVMGAYVILYPRVHVHMLAFLPFPISIAVPAVWMLGYWFVVQLVGGLGAEAGAGGVAFWAHVGGFLAGVGLIHLFRNPELVARHPFHGWSGPQGRTRAWHRVDSQRMGRLR